MTLADEEQAEGILSQDAVEENPEAFRFIGEEVTKMLDYRPAKFFRHQIYPA
jgi:hypothetical protein